MDAKVTRHFKEVDPILYKALIKIGGVENLTTRVPKDYFLSLTREIIAQQLNGKVAEVIFQRFLNLFPKKQVTTKRILKLKHEQIRAVGMSNSKVKYIQDLAEKAGSGELNFEKIKDLKNEEVIEALTQVKGIGHWSAEMFLMFALEREDIFSYGDLGLKKAIQKLYKLDHKKNLSKVEVIVSKWSPYKSYACRVLWKSLD